MIRREKNERVLSPFLSSLFRPFTSRSPTASESRSLQQVQSLLAWSASHSLGSPLPALATLAPPTDDQRVSPHPVQAPLSPLPASSPFYSTHLLPRRPSSSQTMPSSLYVPVLVAGMLITVRSLSYPPFDVLSDVSQGLEQLFVVQMAGPSHHQPRFLHFKPTLLLSFTHRICNV